MATHKKASMPEDEMYVPILVGADTNGNVDINYQYDNDGEENISAKNPNYSELTAVYWIWKNTKNLDVVGLVHYRRMFFRKRRSNLNQTLRQQDIEKLLLKNEIILPKERNYIIETNYMHYVHAHEEEPIEVTKQVIEENFPEYFNSFNKVMLKRKAHMFNMHIMKWDAFDSYCDFIFGVLSQVESRVDISKYSDQEKRVFGYISELLMDVWIDTKKISYIEVPWGQLGPKHTLKKAFYLLARKFGVGERRTHF